MAANQNNDPQQQAEPLPNPHKSNKRKRQRCKLDPSTATVVIVGSGLAGLSVAVSLKNAGYSKIDVYERDPSLQHQKEGYGLTLTYNPKGPLAQLGVLETVARLDCPSRSHYLFHQQEAQQDGENSARNLAVPMGYFGNAFFKGCRRGYGQRGNLRVPRKVLRKVLHDTLLEEAPLHNKSSNDGQQENNPPSGPTVHWNKTLLDFTWEPSTQQYRVRFVETKADPSESPKITTIVADLLVAADGIRSAVLQQLYNQKHRKMEKAKGVIENASDFPIREYPERYGLRPMGIRMILGIAQGIDHPLLRERGFYTIDTHGHRLFTMPYYSDRFGREPQGRETTKNDNQVQSSKTKIMWQLSFSTESNPKTLDSQSLRKYVLDTFSTWHPPVLDLVKSTPSNGVWGTDLMDRDPNQVYKDLVAGRYPRLVICGDALHSMSPFKGQGANQALADGPLLAKCLAKSSVDGALTNWWRETLNRTVPVVNASRQAAQDWHNPSVILANRTNGEYHGFAGVQPNAVPSLIKTLKEKSIGPHTPDLDGAIADVIFDHGWSENSSTAKSSSAALLDTPLDENLCQTLLKLAADGNTENLRKMSLPSFSPSGDVSLAMVQVRDEHNRSCLHLSALHGHFFACKWLLTELSILEQWKSIKVDCDNCTPLDCGPKDRFGKTAFDYALESGDKELIHLFEVVMHECENRKASFSHNANAETTTD